jgi:hypothetical protein
VKSLDGIGIYEKSESAKRKLEKEEAKKAKREKESAKREEAKRKKQSEANRKRTPFNFEKVRNLSLFFRAALIR